MMELKEMTIRELEELIAEARRILTEKKLSGSKEFEFEFSATSDPLTEYLRGKITAKELINK